MSYFHLTTIAARWGPKRTAASCEAADQHFGRECGLLRKVRHDCVSSQGQVCGRAAWQRGLELLAMFPICRRLMQQLRHRQKDLTQHLLSAITARVCSLGTQ